MAKANVQVIKLDGQNYLGTIKDNKILCNVGVDPNEYVKQKALGELLSITVGDAKNLTCRDLKNTEKLALAQAKGLWKIARSQAIEHAAVQVFNNLLGK